MVKVKTAESIAAERNTDTARPSHGRDVSERVLLVRVAIRVREDGHFQPIEKRVGTQDARHWCRSIHRTWSAFTSPGHPLKSAA